MSTKTLRVGFTKSDRLGDYIPACDGYRAGAEQEVVEVDYPDYMETAHEVAERVFIATNAPEEVLVEIQRKMLRLLRLAGPFLRALSVGDTVTYDGVTLACARVGWTEVTA